MGLRHLSGSAADEQDTLQRDVFLPHQTVRSGPASHAFWHEIRTVIFSHGSGVVAHCWPELDDSACGLIQYLYCTPTPYTEPLLKKDSDLDYQNEKGSFAEEEESTESQHINIGAERQEGESLPI